MNCQECRRWWSPYLDSELDSTKTFEVSEHLRNCPACRARFEREERVDELMKRSLRATRMPEDMWSDLTRRVRRSPQRVRSVWARPLAIAASIVMLITAGVLFFHGQPQEAAQAAQVERMADLLRAATPQLVAFHITEDKQDGAQEAQVAERLAELTHRLLRATVAIDKNRSHGHPIELIGVKERTDNLNTKYVEVRLNCCGKPVLLAISERGLPHAIAEIDEVCQRCPSKGCPGPCRKGSIETRSLERNGVIIAGATADHDLDSLFAAITVDRT